MNTTQIVFENVSKFYGDVLGVNRVNLSIPPGITSLVGPNGSGKTTLMNLMTGLIQPSRGRIRVL
jgi:ABC-2 type transport system ATP-binding protein